MKRHTQKQLLHLFAGLLIVVLAFHFFEREDVIHATILFGAGCLFLILAGAHTWIDKNIRRISSFFFFLEAITFYYAANHYKAIGRNEYFNWLIAASILFIVLGVIYIATKKRKGKRHKSRSKTRSTEESF
jgi:cell division protein FtsW (lipid II flippase)